MIALRQAIESGKRGVWRYAPPGGRGSDTLDILPGVNAEDSGIKRWVPPKRSYAQLSTLVNALTRRVSPAGDTRRLMLVTLNGSTFTQWPAHCNRQIEVKEPVSVALRRFTARESMYRTSRTHSRTRSDVESSAYPPYILPYVLLVSQGESARVYRGV